MGRCILIVQGEGRGHLSQGMALSEYLQEAGHLVEAVFAGGRDPEMLPGYFTAHFNKKLEFFRSPYLLRTPNRKGIYMGRTILHNLVRAFSYLREVRRIRSRINEVAPDVVFNLYDMVGALALRGVGPGIRRIGIGHHFLLHLEGYRCPGGSVLHRQLLALHTRLIMGSCDTILALSFREVPGSGKIRVIPPLVRKKIRKISRTAGERYLVYLLTVGFLYDLVRLAGENPGFRADIFTNLPTGMELPAGAEPPAGASGMELPAGAESPAGASGMELPAGIRVYPPDEDRFLEKMASCRAVITTSGFDTAAEAAYHGIPLVVVPVQNHYEQRCNSFDVERSGIGIRSAGLDAEVVDRLGPGDNKEFRKWVSRAGDLLLKWSFE